MNIADLITDAQLADTLGMELDRFHTMRRRKGWPCVKFGRTTFRFTPAQVEDIIAMQTVTPGAMTRTSRSSGRRRS